MRITKTKIVKQDGEYRVMAYDQHGKRMPAADYFTNDKQDAISTAKAMIG